MKRRPWAIVALASMLSLSACGGGLADANSAPDPLLVLHGTATGSSGKAVRGPLSLTLAWATPRTFVTPYNSPFCAQGDTSCTFDSVDSFQQLVNYDATFPFDFEFAIVQPPPLQGRSDLSWIGGTGSIAFGVLVAFVDANGNGRLDRGSPGIVGEEVLTASDRPCALDPATASAPKSFFTLVYLDGNIPEHFYQKLKMPAISQGFNLISLDKDQQPILLDSSARVVLDFSPLKANDEYFLSQYQCVTQQLPLVNDEIDGVPANAYIYSEGQTANCYDWTVARRDGACAWKKEHWKTCIPPGQQPPADWPSMSRQCL